jgi:hydroxymethylpyrimidine pyrophosphatase-like HAD family hydrolase
LVLSDENIDELYDKIVKELDGIKDEVHIIKADYFIEFVHKRANKRLALTHLVGVLGMDMSEVVAFGDGLNDIEFMEGAGLAIAVANAKPQCKVAAAKVSTKTNNEDAVAHEVDTLLAAGRFVTVTADDNKTPTAAAASISA